MEIRVKTTVRRTILVKRLNSKTRLKMKNSIFRLNMMNEYEKVIGFIVTWSEGLTAEVWTFSILSKRFGPS